MLPYESTTKVVYSDREIPYYILLLEQSTSIQNKLEVLSAKLTHMITLPLAKLVSCKSILYYSESVKVINISVSNSGAVMDTKMKQKEKWTDEPTPYHCKLPF